MQFVGYDCIRLHREDYLLTSLAVFSCFKNSMNACNLIRKNCLNTYAKEYPSSFNNSSLAKVEVTIYHS